MLRRKKPKQNIAISKGKYGNAEITAVVHLCETFFFKSAIENAAFYVYDVIVKIALFLMESENENLVLYSCAY